MRKEGKKKKEIKEQAKSPRKEKQLKKKSNYNFLDYHATHPKKGELTI